MRCFGVEGSDFLVLVEKLHGTVQQHMDIDPLVGVGAIGGCLGDLKDAPFETDGVILGHRALLLEAQRLFDLF